MTTIFFSSLFTFLFTVVYIELINIKRYGGYVNHEFWYYKLYSHFKNNYYDVYDTDCIIRSLDGYYEGVELPTITRIPFPTIFCKYYIKGYGLVFNCTRLSDIIDKKFSSNE